MYRLIAVVVAVGLTLETIHGGAHGEEGVIYRLIHDPDGPVLYEESERPIDGFYQGKKYWWNQDMVSAAVAKLAAGVVGPAAKSLLSEICTAWEDAPKLLPVTGNIGVLSQTPTQAHTSSPETAPGGDQNQ